MQFMPDTWLRWGVDADGDGIANPWIAADAIYAAARYLAASGGQSDISRAVYSYNHADWYVNEVLSLAQTYGDGGPTATSDVLQLQQLQQGLDAGRGRVVRANGLLVRALKRERAMRSVSRVLHGKVDAAALISDRLAAEQRAALYDVRLQQVQDKVDAARSALRDAEKELRLAQQRAQAPSFAPGAGALLGAPSYGNGYVFPVGGGPSVVSAAHTHHDYPAVDIAAPEGSPVFALADSVVLNAWQAPDERCGIGLTLRADDGQVWTYCHLSYLSPSVVDGSRLSVGEQIGLVGHTGDASGPHLHLQLQPPTAWPQQEAWFQGFAGRAFRWQDAPTPVVAQTAGARVFAVVPTSSQHVIGFRA
jgi:murein DD-endopeptidase MepM/ murein hydrolase activator NlpD